MTVSSQTSRVDYAGDGVTAIFPVPFYFLENTHLKVILSDDTTGVESILVLNTDYTVTGAGVLAGGSITVPSEPAVGFTLTILRSVPVTQETDYVPNDPFPAESHERALDKLTMVAQQVSTDIKGAIRVAESDPEPSRLPNAVSRALFLLGFDGSGNPITVAPTSGSAADLALSLANDIDPAKGAGQVGFKGRSAFEKLSDVFSVKDFGAIGDGITDDTTAIQLAIDTSALSGDRARLYFPAGSYNFSSVIISATQSISLVGDGASSVLMGTVHLQGTGVSTALSAYRVDVSYLNFTGTDKLTDVGVKLEYTWQCRIHHCHFKTLFKGVSIVQSSIRDYITDCTFEDVSNHLYQEDTVRSADITWSRNQGVTQVIRSIFLQNMDGLNVTDNIFFAQPGVTKNHILVKNITDATARHTNWIRIVGNTFFECGDTALANGAEDGAVVFEGANTFESQIIISDNIFGWNFQPIRINGQATRPSSPNGGIIISNNYIEQQFDKRGECHSIFVSNVNKGVDIKGNRIWKTGGNIANTYDAIRIESCSFPAVKGNEILNEGATTHRYGIALSSCTSSVVAANSIFGSGTAPIAGSADQTNNTSSGTAKLSGVAWASAIANWNGSTISYSAGRNNLTVANAGVGLWTVTYDISAPSTSLPAPIVIAAGANVRLVGAPSASGFSFETLTAGGSRTDSVTIMSISAL